MLGIQTAVQARRGALPPLPSPPLVLLFPVSQHLLECGPRRFGAPRTGWSPRLVARKSVHGARINTATLSLWLASLLLQVPKDFDSSAVCVRMRGLPFSAGALALLPWLRA